MKRTLSLLALIAVLFSLAACGGKKPPELVAAKTKNVLSVLRGMIKSYEKKDLDSYLSEVASGFREREAYSKALAAVFSKYETIRFNIQYSKMIVMIEEQGTIKASFNWDAEWQGAGGMTQKDGGRVTLVFEPGDFKLISIDGKNPFLPQQIVPQQRDMPEK